MNALEQILRVATAEALHVLPYVLGGVVVSEAARYTAGAELLERIGMKTPRVAIALAALFGVLSPLCTYGTVPVVLHLLRAGVPAAPLVTFLATSSLINPQLLVMTWGGLGPGIALARLLAVLSFGLVLGATLHFVPAPALLLPVLANEVGGTRARKRFSWRSYLKRCLESLEFVGFLVMGCDPKSVDYLVKLDQSGFGTTDVSQIRILGRTVSEVQKEFAGPDWACGNP